MHDYIFGLLVLYPSQDEFGELHFEGNNIDIDHKLGIIDIIKKLDIVVTKYSDDLYKFYESREHYIGRKYSPVIAESKVRKIFYRLSRYSTENKINYRVGWDSTIYPELDYMMAHYTLLESMPLSAN